MLLLEQAVIKVRRRVGRVKAFYSPVNDIF